MARTLSFAALLAGAQASQATTLTPTLAATFPDLVTSTATLTYTYVAVCQKTNGMTGICGTSSYNTPRWDLSYGMLTVTKDSTQTLKTSSTTSYTVSNVAGNDYDLTIILGFNNSNGGLTGGTAIATILATDPWTGDATYTSNLLAKGSAGVTGFNSGTIVSGKPTSAIPYGYSQIFGYGGTDLSGKFEFMFNTVGGDMAATGSNGGIIATTTNLSHVLLPAAGGATWDSKNINFWKNNFTATVNVDTFVPVPAAVWLFGSAMGVMMLVRRRDA